MKFHRPLTIKANTRRAIRVGIVLAFILALAPLHLVLAQRTFRKTYPARSNVRLQLRNWSGTINVEVWRKDAIEVSSEMEAGMRLEPQLSDGALEIDVKHDNLNSRNMGSANFAIKVPAFAVVDVETKEGNIIVRGVQGDMVRAAISTRGDIELTEINARQVFASTRIGDIFFAGDMRAQGMYKFMAAEGDVRLRLPNSIQFSLDARAARQIELGGFTNRFNRTDNGRRAHGSIGRGNASCDVMSLRGSIFILR